MKYINKLPTPQFFIDDTQYLTSWSDYHSSKKRKLKKYILEKEQSFLCCYCEMKITQDADKSHIEHIKPKSIDVLRLTFDYSNLTVSCQGNHFNEIGDNSKNTCGHIKENIFDENKFLNPTLRPDISDYFIFDSDTGKISASTKDTVKAEYTVNLLNLNGKNDKLAEARKKAKDAFIRNFSRLPIKERKEKLKKYLHDESNEFITFFRYIFRNVN